MGIVLFHAYLIITPTSGKVKSSLSDYIISSAPYSFWKFLLLILNDLCVYMYL